MGFLTAIFAGPAAGFLGSLVTGIFSMVERAQEMKKMELQHAHETNLQKLNIQARGQELESEEAIATTEAMAVMLKSSYEHDASYGRPSQAVGNVLRFVRPVFTLMAFIVVAILAFTVPEGSITIGEEIMTIKERVISSLIFMAEAAFFWWFADRRKTNK